MSTNNWEQLDCPFFAKTCRLILGHYFDNLGFKELRQTARGGLIYKKSSIFIEVSYDTNLFPDYTIRCTIGRGEGAYDNFGGFNGVPMWYILSENHPYREGTHWTFKTTADLENVLTEIKEEFIRPVSSSLFSDLELLAKITEDFKSYMINIKNYGLG